MSFEECFSSQVIILLSLRSGSCCGQQLRLRLRAESFNAASPFAPQILLCCTRSGFLPYARLLDNHLFFTPSRTLSPLCAARFVRHLVSSFFLSLKRCVLIPTSSMQVTTTRKIFSVLLSIFVHNHKLNAQGWAGIGLSCLGIVGELQDKYEHGKAPKPKAPNVEVAKPKSP